MKFNKKIAIIMSIVLVVLIIIGIIATICIINYQKNKEIKETSNLGEFVDEEEKDENNLDEISEDEDIPVSSDEEVIEPENNTPVQNNNTSSTYNGTYYIKVNYTANVVTVYKKDSSGNYTIPVKAMVCSTGTSTPRSGVYSTTDKYQWRLLVGNVYGQYATRIVDSILFHSVPYTRQDPASLEYWEYDKLGQAASLGCIRLTVQDAKWIYDNCSSGTKVEFYSDSNPGPLGKPTAKKISNEDANVRNWDPTDPRSNNPWKTYNPNKPNNVENTKPNEEQNKPNTSDKPDENKGATESPEINDNESKQEPSNTPEDNKENTENPEIKDKETNQDTSNKQEENKDNVVKPEVKDDEDNTENMETI